MTVIQNIINNFNLLQKDFLGISINPYGIGNFFLHIFIASSLFTIFYLIGKKLRIFFFKENQKYTFFINIVLGYITIGTGIGMLGVFSLLQPQIIWPYLALITLAAFYPLNYPSLKTKNILTTIKNKKDLLSIRKNLITYGAILFILIAFLRLITPEITEDGYHTDLLRLYLKSHTTIHETRDPLHVIPYPQLAEMIYIIPVFLGDKETARFIHFGFYLLIISLLFSLAKEKEYYFVKFAPLLFVTAPIVIRYSPSQYVDFFAVFPFLLSILLIKKDAAVKNIILPGIILGAVFSVKMWTLVYLPVFLIFITILNRFKILNTLKLLLFFIISSLIVPLLWYMRSFIITGNPIYPIFSKLEYLEVDSLTTPLSPNYFGFNWNMFSLQNMIVYSPLFFLGIIFLLFRFSETTKKLKHSPLALFFTLLMLEQLIIKVDLGRYLVSWYTVAVSIVSAGILFALHRNHFSRYPLIFIYFVIFSYYFINTLFMLPYGFGWTDKNKYLTRVLGRDNANYYDFDRLFNKWISDKDTVATYGIVSFYYADFNYIDIGYIFSKNNRSFDLLKERKVTKLLIKGGDIEWFCKRLTLNQCNKEKTKLLATYPPDIKKYNLYSIKN